MPADYDGDGKADLSSKTDWGEWHIDFGSNGFGSWDVSLTGYGGPGAVPVPADYDGDGAADLSVKDSSGAWYIDHAAGGFGRWNAKYSGYGADGAHPVPADYDGDGQADLAVKTDSGEWHIDYAANGFGVWDVNLTAYGPREFSPAPADYDGDGKADLSVRWDFGDWFIDYASNGFGSWDVMWNPDRVSLTSGSKLRPRDLAVFDSKWMNAFESRRWVDAVRGTFDIANQGYAPGEMGVWVIGERMSAMARMYDLTGAPRYLNHLRDLAEIVLGGRDDHRPDSSFLYDTFRDGQVMPAWGVHRVSYGMYHHSVVVVAGVYAYPIASFARIVAEDPSLQLAYGEQARAAATGVLETFEAFLPELRVQNGNENYWFNPPAYGDYLQDWRCQWAFDEAVRIFNPDPPNELQSCKDFRKAANKPVAHNENHAFLMALMELSRALDTDFYKRDLAPARRAAVERIARSTIPTVVARGQRYFANRGGFRVNYDLAAGRAFATWLFSEGEGQTVADNDTGHTALNMRYIGLLRRNKARLNELLTTSVDGKDRIALSDNDMRLFANTFVVRVAKGGHLTENLAGGIPNPVDKRDGDCDGWLNLAQFEPLVYRTCEQVTLNLYNPVFNDEKTVSAVQPHLTVGNHAALLAAKRFNR